MQHQQNRDDFADAQAGLGSARRAAVAEQIGFPVRQKRLTKIVHRAEGFDQPLQHVDLLWHDWFGSILRLIDSQCVNASDTRYRGYPKTALKFTKIALCPFDHVDWLDFYRFFRGPGP